MALFLEARVDDDGDGAVVDECHLHLGAKDALLGGLAQQAGQLIAIGIIEGDCHIMACGMDAAAFWLTEQGPLVYCPCSLLQPFTIHSGAAI